MRLALLRYWHCEDEVAGKPRKKIFPNTKAEVLHVSLAFLQPWRYYMCDEVGFIPDLKPYCVLIVSVALAVSTPVSLQTYGDLCECDITYFTLISLYRLILFSWAPLDKARFSSFCSISVTPNPNTETLLYQKANGSKLQLIYSWVRRKTEEKHGPRDHGVAQG